MTFSCAEEAFKLLAQTFSLNLAQNYTYTKIGAKSDTKPPPNSDGKTPLKLRQTPSKLHVRNRDFVDFEQFSIAYFLETSRI